MCVEGRHIRKEEKKLAEIKKITDTCGQGLVVRERGKFKLFSWEKNGFGLSNFV